MTIRDHLHLQQALETRRRAVPLMNYSFFDTLSVPKRKWPAVQLLHEGTRPQDPLPFQLNQLTPLKSSELKHVYTPSFSDRSYKKLSLAT
jgi:hypothetical protein